MSIYQLKSAFQSLLRPLVIRLAAAGVTANVVTIFAMAVSVQLGMVLFFSSLMQEAVPGQSIWLLLPIWLFIRMALNAIDGMLAREHGQKSNLGAILNEVGDVIADAALTMPFLILAWRLDDPIAVPLVFTALILAMITEFIGVLGPMLGASRRYDGPLGKSDRAFVFGALALVYGLGLIPMGVPVLSWVFGIASLLLLATCIKRARAMLAEVNNA
ncbi:CDP-alcohol phosphatidyltransferase family protein [Chitinibacter sp. S2-10]|uniref:CDP-alcohol phosphatidyltransferase family protein n=1 Tax=Chitinibacter sp. S2-10 TaxID=3373597 RepID=UPI00397774A6